MRPRAGVGRSERGSGSDFEGFATRVTIKSGIGRVTKESHLRGGLGGRGGGREAASEGESSGHVTSTTRAVGPVPRRWWVCAIAVGRRPIQRAALLRTKYPRALCWRAARRSSFVFGVRGDSCARLVNFVPPSTSRRHSDPRAPRTRTRTATPRDTRRVVVDPSVSDPRRRPRAIRGDHPRRTTRDARRVHSASSSAPREQRHPHPRDHERGVAHRCRRR